MTEDELKRREARIEARLKAEAAEREANRPARDARERDRRQNEQFRALLATIKIV